MKKEFSTKWIASKQPRKQRKYGYNAPNHIRRKFMSAALSKDLRTKYGRRSLEVRKQDEVKIMRGKFANKTGKITEVSLKKERIAVENIQITKRDGTKVNVWMHPSNVMIMNITSDDKKRLKNKTGKTEVKPEKKEHKTENKIMGEKNVHKKK